MISKLTYVVRDENSTTLSLLRPAGCERRRIHSGDLYAIIRSVGGIEVARNLEREYLNLWGFAKLPEEMQQIVWLAAESETVLPYSRVAAAILAGARGGRLPGLLARKRSEQSLTEAAPNLPMMPQGDLNGTP